MQTPTTDHVRDLVQRVADNTDLMCALVEDDRPHAAEAIRQLVRMQVADLAHALTKLPE